MSTNQVNLFVGCYGSSEEQSIHWLQFDSEHLSFKHIHSASGVENPSYLALTDSHLYSVSEVEEGEVVAFEMNHAEQTLKELNRGKTHGWAPCYIEINDSQSHIFTANYGGGNIAVHQLTENGIIERTAITKEFNGLAKARSVETHPHMIHYIPNTNKYIVPDLGLNSLFVYEFNEVDEKLKPITEIKTPKGSGPRHVTFDQNNQMLYVVNELNSTVLVYSYNEDATKFDLKQVVTTLPEEYEEENYCADIHMSVDGKYVFASNRGHHSIVSYRVDEEGLLEVVQILQTEGKWPRNFLVMPNGRHLLVANEHTDSIEVLEIEANGQLKKIDCQYNVSKPVCLKML